MRGSESEQVQYGGGRVARCELSEENVALEILLRLFIVGNQGGLQYDFETVGVIWWDRATILTHRVGSESLKHIEGWVCNAVGISTHTASYPGTRSYEYRRLSSNLMLFYLFSKSKSKSQLCDVRSFHGSRDICQRVVMESLSSWPRTDSSTSLRHCTVMHTVGTD